MLLPLLVTVAAHWYSRPMKVSAFTSLRQMGAGAVRMALQPGICNIVNRGLQIKTSIPLRNQVFLLRKEGCRELQVGVCLCLAARCGGDRHPPAERDAAAPAADGLCGNERPDSP